MRKVKALFLAIVLVLGMSFNVYAANIQDSDDPNDYSWETEDLSGTPATERWSYISTTSQGMHISNGTATMTASIIGYQGVTNKVIIYMYLQQYYDDYWHNLTWTKDEFNNYRGSKERYKSGCGKGKYRLKVSNYAYGPNDKYENHIAYSAIYNY